MRPSDSHLHSAGATWATLTVCGVPIVSGMYVSTDRRYTTCLHCLALTLPSTVQVSPPAVVNNIHYLVPLSQGGTTACGVPTHTSQPMATTHDLRQATCMKCLGAMGIGGSITIQGPAGPVTVHGNAQVAPGVIQQVLHQYGFASPPKFIPPGGDLHGWLEREDTPVMGSDPRYPHKCPRCGSEAYVGLNEVEHRYQGECGK